MLQTNSYDSWTSEMFKAYILDLAVFGTNHIDLIPPNSDDFSSSPHRLVNPLAMLNAVSAAADAYDINCSLWYPAMYDNYSNPSVMAAAEAEWTSVFTAMPRINGIFLPGGDPGKHTPSELISIAAAQAAVLHKYHPGASVWLSPQSFNAMEMREWNEQIRLPSTRSFLTGIVYGPWIRVTLEEFVPTVPSYYPLRNYPDLGHTISCELPVPEWDYAFAFTEGRETINPRPRYHAGVVAHDAPMTAGFAGYSEGCNDDVNKVVWSALHWGADQSAQGLGPSISFPSMEQHFDSDDSLIDAIIRDYAGFFGGSHLATDYIAVIYGLEENWHGRAAGNDSTVEHTFAAMQRLESAMNVRDLFNWRLMQARYRACFDMIVRWA